MEFLHNVNRSFRGRLLRGARFGGGGVALMRLVPLWSFFSYRFNRTAASCESKVGKR